MANLVEVPFEEQCICCEREEPPRARNEILNEYGDKNDRIYNLVSNFFGVSFDMQENFGCYICNICKMHLQNYFGAKSKVELLIETVLETSQELVPDNGGNWSVSNINICIACSEKSRKKKYIIQSDSYLSTRKRKQSRPPPKPGEAYRSVSDFFNLSFKTHKSCGSFICLRCRYRLTRVEEELTFKDNLKRHILNSSQILKPLNDVFISLYDFDTFEEDELPFQRGDHFHAIKEGEVYPNWMFALNLSTGLQGYIPTCFVTRHGGELNSEIWFQDVDIKHAEEMLTNPFNQKGSFLVRRAPDGTSYVLSVLVTDPDELKPQVLHFKIQLMKNGFYRLINLSESFANIPKLVDFYKGPSRVTLNQVLMKLDQCFRRRSRLKSLRTHGCTSCHAISSHAKGRGLPHRLTTPCARVRPPIPFRGFQIKRKAISVNLNKNSKEFLGDGSVGEVYFGLQRKITKIAVKKLKRQTDLNKFVTATTAISKLTHPRLVQLLGVCTDTEPYLIITEYMINGPLPSFLKENKEKIKLHFLIKIALQITDGMQFLEDKVYVHRNLRAANILLGERNQVKISDYGISGLLLDVEDISSGRIKTFPELWTAPEAVFDNKYSSKSDVWSFGVVLYEMITFSSILPYAELRKDVTAELKIKDSSDDSLTITCLEKIKEGYRMSQPPECPDEYYGSMCECWNEDPDERPSFSHWHNYFENYELPKTIDEELSSTSDSANDFLAEPSYGKQMLMGSSGYGSFEIKDNAHSTSRSSSRNSNGRLMLRKLSLDFHKSGFSSRSGSVVGSLAKSSKLKTGKQSSSVSEYGDLTSTSIPPDVISSPEVNNETIKTKEEGQSVDIEEQNKISADKRDTESKNNNGIKESSAVMEAEYIDAEKTKDDELAKSRQTSAIALGKSASRMSRNDMNGSRTTSVNSFFKKNTKESTSESIIVDTETTKDDEIAKSRQTSALNFRKSASRMSKIDTGSRTNSVNSFTKKTTKERDSEHKHSRSKSSVESKPDDLKQFGEKVAKEEKDSIDRIDSTGKEDKTFKTSTGTTNIDVETKQQKSEDQEGNKPDSKDNNVEQNDDEKALISQINGIQPGGDIKTDDEHGRNSKMSKAAVGKAGSRMSKKGIESRTTSVNSIAKKGAKSKNTDDHIHSQSRISGENKHKKVMSSTEKSTKENENASTDNVESALKETGSRSTLTTPIDATTDERETQMENEKLKDESNNMDSKDKAVNEIDDKQAMESTLKENGSRSTLTTPIDATTEYGEIQIEKEESEDNNKEDYKDSKRRIHGNKNHDISALISDTQPVTEDQNGTKLEATRSSAGVTNHIDSPEEKPKEMDKSNDNVDVKLKQKQQKGSTGDGRKSKLNTPGGTKSQTSVQNVKNNKTVKENKKGPKPTKTKDENKGNTTKKDSQKDQKSSSKPDEKPVKDETDTKDNKTDTNNQADEIGKELLTTKVTDDTSTKVETQDYDKLNNTEANENVLDSGLNTTSNDKEEINLKDDKAKKPTDDTDAEKTSQSKSSAQIKDGKTSKMSKKSEKSGPINTSSKGAKTKTKTVQKKK